MQKRVKNPKLPKNRPAVPVQVSAVPVQVSLCHFLHKLYLTFTGTPVPIFHLFFICGSIFIFLQIGNSSADVKSILVDCLPSRVSLHAHLSLYSYSAQTDCVHGIDNCTSFFRHFHTHHGAHRISCDQGS